MCSRPNLLYYVMQAGVVESLTTAAPSGVDCYFDNVGGEMTAAVLSKMNTRGR